MKTKLTSTTDLVLYWL